MSFWTELRSSKKPFFCLAPMADVTDPAFRVLLTRYGKPDVMWTEFVSANGLMSHVRNSEQKETRPIDFKKFFPFLDDETVIRISSVMSDTPEPLLRDLMYSEEERPIVAQLFSSDPSTMQGAAKLCAELGFDGIDINMGCPDRTIEKQGAGAAMIRTPEIAVEIIRAVKRGIESAGKDIPVSVKTRVGYNSVQIDEWIPLILSEGVAALTVHARTRKELSKVPADWSRIKSVIALRDRIAPETVIIGNGDVTSLSDGIEKARASGCDGVMVGRALFGAPWFFDATRSVVATLPRRRARILRALPFIGKWFETRRRAAQSDVRPITISERLDALVEHTQLFETMLGDIKSFAIMKKHYKAYCTGFAGAKEFRMRLMDAKNATEVATLVQEFKNN